LSNADKGAIGFILAQELATLTLELDITSEHHLPWTLLILSSYPNQPLAADHCDR